MAKLGQGQEVMWNTQVILKHVACHGYPNEGSQDETEGLVYLIQEKAGNRPLKILLAMQQRMT